MTDFALYSTGTERKGIYKRSVWVRQAPGHIVVHVVDSDLHRHGYSIPADMFDAQAFETWAADLFDLDGVGAGVEVVSVDDIVDAQLTDAGRALAMALWREQLAAGLGYVGEEADEDLLTDWLGNRSFGEPITVLNCAAAGDVASITMARVGSGLQAII